MEQSEQEKPAVAASLTFWENWFEGVDSFPDDMRLAWYDAVMRFAFRGLVPDLPTSDSPLSAIRWNAVQMVRATITISRRRRNFGAKGGSKRQAKRKQTPSKAEAKGKQVQEQVQVQVQEQEQYATTATAQAREELSKPDESVFVAAGLLAGVPEEYAREVYQDLVGAGWADADGRPVGNWRRYLKSAWNAAQKKLAARANDPDGNADFGGIPIAR